MNRLFQVKILIVFFASILDNNLATSSSAQPPYSERFRNVTENFAQQLKHDEAKRGLDIGVHLKVPTEKNLVNLKDAEKELLKAIQKELTSKEREGTGLGKVSKKKPPKKLLLKPAFQCDDWDVKTRTCWLDRNIGDTVTFSLSTGMFGIRGRNRPDVLWKKEFAEKDGSTKMEYAIDFKNPSRNMVIGRRGYELRISPITELDIEDNQFSATFIGNNGSPFSKVNFKIRVMPEDLGFVYIGETIDLSIESYVTLPLESMTFHWYTEKEGEYSTLPSNMKISSTGATLRISELRQEQEGVVTCSIYTNRGIHATKKRFLIKNLTKDKDVLKSFADHNITLYEEKKHKRNKLPGDREKQTIEEYKKVLTKLIATQKRSQVENKAKLAKITARQIIKNKRSRNEISNFLPKQQYDKHLSTSFIPQKKQSKITATRKRSSKTARETNQAKIEGEEFTLIKPEKTSNLDTNSNDHDLINKYGTKDDNINDQILDEVNFAFSNNSNQETIVNIERHNNENMEDDKVSQIISYCIRDTECSKHASCLRTSLKENGFCQCLPKFYGPGIFCREDM